MERTQAQGPCKKLPYEQEINICYIEPDDLEVAV